jgi:hypothetical protein
VPRKLVSVVQGGSHGQHAALLLSALSLLSCVSSSPAQAKTPSPVEQQPRAAPTAGTSPPAASAVTLAAPAAIAAPLPPPVVNLEGTLGSAAPVLLRAAAPDGRWVALCQAREDTDQSGRLAVQVGPHGEFSGDSLSEYWVLGQGPGSAIDQFVDSSPDGRFVATIEGGHLLLHDTWLGNALDLSARGADLRDDQASFLGHRALRFDPSGERLLYLRSLRGEDSRESQQIVVRELGDGSERSFSPGEGLLWRADFDATGELVIVKIVTADNNKNKRLQWPYPERRRLAASCTGPIASFNVWEYPGDQPSVRVYSLRTGKLHDAPGFIASFGAGWLARDADLNLSLQGLDGAVLLADKECNARVVHSDPLRQLLVAACLDAKDGPALELLGPGYRKPLALKFSPFEVDIELPQMPFLVPLYARGAAAILDLDTRKTHAIGNADWVVATYGKRALVRHGDRLQLWSEGQLSPLPGTVQNMRSALVTGSMAFVPPLLVDLDSGRKLGEPDVRALALSDKGALLVPQHTPSAPEELPLGPLTWLPPPANP